ncbi:hypothetical protein CP8484711_0599B, partial [Chlamydia psittaci 84-8471/1]|jgi:hypothetical protein
LT